ncbi:MAG: tetratricopeptide repeat protein [Myxococcales bacterium]|nr:tetratricopeptide repeat protein [Myxococcales bacterium]MDD9967032.1 tetratricopeptide repeat protein [Myxococcales bacterium]
MANSDSKQDQIEHGPMDQFSAHLDRGWDLLHQGDLAGALLSAEKSLELDAQSPEAYNLLGFVRAAQGEAAEALEHYRHALALDDSFVEAMLNAAEVLIHPMHDFDAAQGLVRDALDLAEDDDEVADALLISFDAHMHQGDRQAAAVVAGKLPGGPFSNPKLDFLVGRAYFEVERLDQAQQLFERALKRDHDNPDLHYYLGLLWEAREKPERAVLAFVQARKLDALEPDPPWTVTDELFDKQVRKALSSLPDSFAAAVDGAMVITSDLPGVELVADGVDPRAALVLDAIDQRATEPKVGRVFVYKRNIQRAVEDALELPEQLGELLQQELAAAFPVLGGDVPPPLAHA